MARVEDSGGFHRAMAGVREKARRGLDARTGRGVAEIMRTGPGSVTDQFQQERGLRADGSAQPWIRTKAFFACPPPPATLRRSGVLLSAWQGRSSASLTLVTPGSVIIGVRDSILPYARVFQALSPTRVVARRRTRSGRLAMQLALGLGPCKAWLSEGRLLSGLVISPRPVGVSRQVVERAGIYVLRSWVGAT